MEVECGGQKCIGLIDTGYQVNLLYKRATEKMDLEVKKESGLGEMRMLGNLRAPVIGKFQEEVMIGRYKMEVTKF